MGRSHCLKCKKGYKNCICPTTCRQCLQLGAMGDDGSCNCCKNCSQPMVTYVNEFEVIYSDLDMLGEIKMSELYLALFLFMNAKLNETKFSILYNKLDFDKAMG